jgi:uncharacterized protein (UPF0210 family)
MRRDRRVEQVSFARRAAEQSLRVEDLLLMSCICGTGLDTVPLPGEVSAGAIESLLLDLSALALRLSKPLTARLMPMPGKKAGDALSFEFPYFAEGKVMELRDANVGGWWEQSAQIPIVPRPPNRS